MKKTKTKCYLYTRVSTSMQVDGYSLDAQRDKLRKYAEYEDMVVAGEYSDEGFSGKNIQGRHEFQRMLQDIQDCKDGVEYVLVFKLSRFGRNAADVLNSLQLMQDFGVNLICVEDGIDSSKDSGKLMISVLSAVAEIERENIRTQTMAGREQKAREGKWNGGFAPYGYRLEKGELLIAEDEVDVIRTIFDRYIHTNDGVSGVAKYLNRQGFVKKLRQNGTIPGFSASFVKSIIDNPVYMGKIAYGRRRTEKKIGTRNEMHVVEQSEFPVYEGKHEAIISEEDWNLAQEKRKINAYRREKVNDPTHAHILSGILKCPCCGKSLYGNIAKAHSKDKKTRYYYYCKNTVTPTGHECTFRLNIEQMEMNRMVASIISAMVSDPRFADAIKAKIGSAVDTNDLEKQLEALQAQLRQTLGTKARLERQMDGLDVNDPYYDRKISDLQRRYDEQYGAIDEIEVQIDDVQSQIRSIRQEKISGDNIYRLLLAFDQVYEAASEVERKEFMRAFIERIELFPEKQPDGNWIRKIIFNFPVPVNGTEVKELPLENETIVESNVLLRLLIAVLVILLIIAAILLLNVVANYSENLASTFPQLFYDLDGLPVADLIVRNDKDCSIAFGCYDGSVNDAAKRGDIDQHIVVRLFRRLQKFFKVLPAQQLYWVGGILACKHDRQIIVLRLIKTFFDRSQPCQHLAQSRRVFRCGVTPCHNRFSHIRINDQYTLVQFCKALCKLQGNSCLAFILIAACDHDGADILTAELQIGSQCLKCLLCKEVFLPRKF